MGRRFTCSSSNIDVERAGRNGLPALAKLTLLEPGKIGKDYLEGTVSPLAWPATGPA